VRNRFQAFAFHKWVNLYRYTTGARIQIDQSATPCTVTITGNPYCVDAASRAVTDVINGGSTAPYSAANQHQLAAAAAAVYGHHPGYGGGLP
jgi:hypothetical protein